MKKGIKFFIFWTNCRREGEREGGREIKEKKK